MNFHLGINFSPFVSLITSIFLLSLTETSSGQRSYQNPNLKLHKCLYNELGRSKELRLPNTIMGHNQSSTFKLQLKCGTRLPHCMQPCSTEVLRRSIPFPEGDRHSIFNVYFTPTGFLRYGSDFFHPDEYCVFGSSKKAVNIEVCRPDCGHTHVCVPKCCSADKVLDFEQNQCKYTQERIWEPTVYKTEDAQVCGEKRANIRFHYYQSIPNCVTQAFFLKSVSGHLEKVRIRFRLLLNGSVVLKELLAKEWKLPKQGQFCLDGVQNFGSNLGPYGGDPLDQILLVCSSEDNELPTDQNGSLDLNLPSNNKLTTTGILYSILLFSGTPFLLITVIVYILLWHKQNVHGWTIFSHTLAMLLNYLGQGMANTVSRVYDSHDNASTSCRLIGIGNHYFALASFCWMTMINYDLWAMFRELKNTVGRSRGMKRFVVYMIIGWGVPFLVVLISVILDAEFGLYGDDGGDCALEIIVPLYGHKSCYIVEEARPYFLFYPIGTLMGINTVFAAVTAYNMYNHNQSAKIAEKKSTKHKRMFSIWAKLFVVMGVALTSEVVVWNLKEKGETLPWYLVFPDVLSLLQAIAIFILFGCQPKIINQLYEEYPSMRTFLDAVRKLPCYSSGSTQGRLV